MGNKEEERTGSEGDRGLRRHRHSCHEVEGEEVVTNAMAAVQQDAVHPGIE